MAKRIVPLALFAVALTFAGAASAADTQDAKSDTSTEQKPQATKPKLHLWSAHPMSGPETHEYQGGLLPPMKTAPGSGANDDSKSGSTPN